ncbi:MAG TPA: hypothetical protein VGD78_13735 [Chthoniobacterales bacterium]
MKDANPNTTMRTRCGRDSHVGFLGERSAQQERHLARNSEAAAYHAAVALPFDALKRAVGQLGAVLLLENGKGGPDQALVVLAGVALETSEALGRLRAVTPPRVQEGVHRRLVRAAELIHDCNKSLRKRLMNPVWKTEGAEGALAGLWKARHALLTASGERGGLPFLAFDQACGCSRRAERRKAYD